MPNQNIAFIERDGYGAWTAWGLSAIDGHRLYLGTHGDKHVLIEHLLSLGWDQVQERGTDHA